LCVEDHDDSCEMIALLLEGVDPRFEVETAPSGEAALEMIARSPFDAYVLDLAMPDIDGAELCRRIRARDPLVPIVFYSADTLPRSRQAGLEARSVELFRSFFRRF
jgi:CheY-like chemotaxis protein